MSKRKMLVRHNTAWVDVALRKRYGVWNFMLDVLMLFLTHGLWLIWIIIREIRR